MTKNTSITSKLIKSVLGLAFVAGALTAATGCDESDMQLLSTLGNVVNQGLSQQSSGGTTTASQNSAAQNSVGQTPDMSSWSGGGSYAFAFAGIRP